MKRLATLFFSLTFGLAVSGPLVHAETVLICHAQSVPASLNRTFHSPLASNLVEKVFDYYFGKGDIAFDTAFSLADGVPTSNWLGNLSSRYGADKVVYFQVIWKQGEAQEAVLDRVDYQVVGVLGTVLKEGSLTADLVSPSKDEPKAAQSVADRVLAGIS